MVTYSLNPQNFINEISKHRELWDLNDDGHRFMSHDKQLAWAKVAKVFIDDYDNLTDPQKLEIYRKLHSKWRNFRDAYVRHLKRDDKKRPYMYAANLAFLKHRYTNNANQSHSEDDSSDDERPAAKTITRKSRVIELSTSKSDEEHCTVNFKRKKLEKDKKQDRSSTEFVELGHPEMAVEPLSLSNYSKEDEDRSFFDSLLPAVREFDLDDKLDFRCEVLKLIKNIRSKVTYQYKTEPIDACD